jgi:hypothetical protein
VPRPPPDSSFGAATFVELRAATEKRILKMGGLRLEGVASGYWTLSVKQSSGLVSHYGSSPSSSARPLDESSSCYNVVFDRQRTDWQFAEPRLTSGVLSFWNDCRKSTCEILRCGLCGGPFLKKRKKWRTPQLI